jgi:hypothetical protein
MFGGNNSNPLVPISFGENHILDDVNALPQLQLLGDCEFFCRLIASYFFYSAALHQRSQNFDIVMLGCHYISWRCYSRRAYLHFPSLFFCPTVRSWKIVLCLMDSWFLVPDLPKISLRVLI